MSPELFRLVAAALGLFVILTMATPAAVDRHEDASVTPVIERDLYQLEGEDTAYRKELLVTAFHEALLLAEFALNSPRDRIFNKYFRPEDRPTVNQVFRNILGNDPKVGARQFGDLKVLLGDPNDECKSAPAGRVGFMKYSEGPPATITVCEELWVLIGTTLEHKSCHQLGNSVSFAMDSISAVVLHEFTHASLAAQPVPGSVIRDYYLPGKFYGPQTAVAIRKQAPEFALRSAENYQWFALEAYYSHKCRKTYRNPRNKFEAIRGACPPEGCPQADVGKKEELR